MQIQLNANLEQIARRYRETPRVEAAARIVLTMNEPALANLLQSHLIKMPTDRVRAKRRAIDDLIGYYSMVEVASLAGCVPAPLPRDRALEMERVLSRPSVIRYYERLYPLVLPQLLRRRLLAREDVRGDSQYLLFVRFLHLSDRSESDNVRAFLYMLDDGVIEGYRLRDVFNEVSSPAKLARALQARSRRPSALTRGLDGLLQFLDFTRELDQLLSEMEHLPMLQSAFWHYHGYWFQQIGIELGGVLASTIEALRDSVGTGRNRGERRMIADTKRDMDAAQRALRRSVSGMYSAVLDRIAFVDAPILSATEAVREVQAVDPVYGYRSITFEDEPVLVIEAEPLKLRGQS